METLQLLYFAICFSVVGVALLFLSGYNLYGAIRPYSIPRDGRGIVNCLWFLLFLPFGVVYGFLAVVFWGGLF